MAASLSAAALKSLKEAYVRVKPPRVFSLTAGKHWGQRSAKLNAEQLPKALEVVHEQYQRGYRGVRLRRHVAMRLAGFCNTNSLMVLVLPEVAGQLIGVYQKWRGKEGADVSGSFAMGRDRQSA